MRPSLPLWLADTAGGGGSGSSTSGGAAPPPPPPDAATRAASRDAAAKIARRLASSLEDEIPAGEVPKPYTTPPGWKAPTLGEQFRYAALKHPYYRYGYAAAVLFGLVGWAIATEEKKHEQQHPHHANSGTGSSSGSGTGRP